MLFRPLYHYRIWGGNHWKQINRFGVPEKTGESWEISVVPGNESIVDNGRFCGTKLPEIIEKYPREILGTYCIEKFGNTFPLLIKFISTAEPLSIQVHPNDDYAKAHHNSLGKTEMWYILAAEPDSRITIGFLPDINKEIYLKNLENQSLESILQHVEVHKGDVFYLPAGRVHAIGKDILLAEIQQNSDITYRMYDFNRKDADGNLRELHTERALDVMDFDFISQPKQYYQKDLKEAVLVQCDYFITRKIQWEGEQEISSINDVFSIIITFEQPIEINFLGSTLKVDAFRTVLIPALIKEFKLFSKKPAEILFISV